MDPVIRFMERVAQAMPAPGATLDDINRAWAAIDWAYAEAMAELRAALVRLPIEPDEQGNSVN